MTLWKGIFNVKAPDDATASEAAASSVEDYNSNIKVRSMPFAPGTSMYQAIGADWDPLEGQRGQVGGSRLEKGTGNLPSGRLGLTDGYTSWTDSTKALRGAIVHSILYLALGVLAYSVVFQHWPIVDSLYFSVVLFTTVGYGDLHPDSPGSMIFTMCFAMYGIVIVGVFLGIFGDMAFHRRNDIHKEKMDVMRHKYLQIFDRSSGVESEETQSVQNRPSSLVSAFAICRAQALGFVVLCAVATPVVLLEKWSFVKGLYWAVITGTTIGLGDETPQHEWSRAICVLFVPLAVGFTGRFLSLIAGAYFYNTVHAEEEKFMSRTLTLSDLNKMDIDNNGSVSPGEFLIFMLVTLQKVEQADIEDILALFHKLDKVLTIVGFLTRKCSSLLSLPQAIAMHCFFFIQQTGDGLLSKADIERVRLRTSARLSIHPAPAQQRRRLPEMFRSVDSACRAARAGAFIASHP
jgi:Ion channel